MCRFVAAVPSGLRPGEKNSRRGFSGLTVSRIPLGSWYRP
jgi:hypothetical protein